MHRSLRSPALLAVLALLPLVASCESGGAGGPFSTTSVAPSSTTTLTPIPPDTTTTTIGPAVSVGSIPYGGEVVIGTDLEPPTLNVLTPGGFGSVGLLIGNAHLTGVFKVDATTLDFIPEVVTELPTVANGGISLGEDGSETIRYTIRPEAVWADGEPITGSDFRYTYDTIMQPGSAISQAVYEDIRPDSIRVEPKAFQFTLDRPTLAAELLFGVILPSHQMEGTAFPADWTSTTWVSGGPFEIQEWVKGEYLILTRNPNYWKTDPETGRQLPYLDRVVFRFLPDTATLLDAFENRLIDIISPLDSSGSIPQLQALTSQGAAVALGPGASWEHIGFEFGQNRLARNGTSYNQFLEYRRAVAHAIDRQRIVDVILGGVGLPMDSYMEAYRPSLSLGAWSQYPYDPARSRELIAALCARADTDCASRPVRAVFTTNVNTPERVELAALLAEMFTDVGIEFEVQLEEPLDFFGATFDFGTWDLASWAWEGAPGMAAVVNQHRFFDPAGVPPDGQNYYRWGTPAVSGGPLAGFDQGPSSVIDEHSRRFAELYQLMQSTIDEQLLAGYLHEAEQILADQVVFIPLYQQTDVGVVWADEIGGFQHNAASVDEYLPWLAGDTWNVERWYRVDLAG